MIFPARKKSILFYLTSLFLAISLFAAFPATTALAQNNNTSQYNTPNFNPEVPRNQHTFTQSAMIEIASSIFCVITGIDPIDPAQGCLDIDPKTHKLGLRPPQDGKPQIGGLMGFLPGMFSMVYTPPASGTDYFRYLAGNFGITQPAYAQVGGGFEALRPLLPVWTAARNVAYLLFVFVFIIIGLAIMLRVKIDPRTVMTLQNQIPRIIIGILLVTFSYAIAGLMIDGMWLLTYAGINAITQADNNGVSPSATNPDATGCTPGGTLQQRATKNLISTPFTFGSQVLKQPCSALAPATEGIKQVTWNVGSAIGTTVFDLITNLFGYSISGWSCGVSIGCWISWIFGTVIGGIAGFLALIIIFLALMWAMFTLWFELLKAYVMLILYIISAPLWIVTGMLPGTPLGFGKWLRRMFVHLAVFPAVVCLLVVAAVLMNIFNNAGPGSFVPPLIGQSNMTGFGSLLAFAVILMAPTLLEVLKENLHATSKGGQIAAGGVVRGISGGAAAPKGLGRGVWGRATQRGYMGQASDLTNYVAGWGNPDTKTGQAWRKIMYKLGGGTQDEKTNGKKHV
jgi:hypothetical protein